MPTDSGTLAVTPDVLPAWQPVPGAPECRYLIFERKADPYSSHAALVYTPHALVIIDTGSDADLAAQISQAVGETLGPATLPVLIFLTHAHWDHLAALPLLSFPTQVPVRVLAQEDALAVLSAGDRRASGAFLFDRDCPKIAVHVPLLPAATGGVAGPRRTPLGDGSFLEAVAVETVLPSGRRIPAESIRIGDDDVVRAFHTPGHSPDSICLLVGELLWVGDLFLAANPVVAGTPGRSHPALIASLNTVAELLAGLPLQLCFSGHGRGLPIAKARQQLAAVRAQAEALGDIASLDPARINLLVEQADALLHEGLALFTLIAGRLYTVSFHLEALEESQTARELLAAVDLEGIDAVLDELRIFAEAFYRQRRMELALPLKGFQAVDRIEKLFTTERLNGLIDPLLLRRARRLLDDFVQHACGFEPSATLAPQAVPAVLADVAEQFSRPATPAQELWDASDDEQAFRLALTRRLAAEVSTVRLAIDLESEPLLPPVETDGARLEETVHAILNAYAGANAGRLRITVRALAGRGCRVEFCPVPERRFSCFPPRLVRFLDGSLRIGGGSLTDVSSATATVLALELQPSAPDRHEGSRGVTE